jgi:hypothetical protein
MKAALKRQHTATVLTQSALIVLSGCFVVAGVAAQHVVSSRAGNTANG